MLDGQSHDFLKCQHGFPFSVGDVLRNPDPQRTDLSEIRTGSDHTGMTEQGNRLPGSDAPHIPDTEPVDSAVVDSLSGMVRPQRVDTCFRHQLEVVDVGLCCSWCGHRLPFSVGDRFQQPYSTIGRKVN